MKDITITNKATIKAEGKFNSKHCKPIVCFSVNESEIRSFSSVIDAAETLGINANYLSTCMNQNKICKGYRICSTKDVATFINEMTLIANNNAEDARKWREQEAEKERIRLVEEKRQNDIARLQEKIDKLEHDAVKYRDKWYETMATLNAMRMELENLQDESAA